ncbi:MAG: hypothetical protein LBN92_00375, partial [Treponema sp.]|nr:hypothetical protein [Treponema sp.]
MFLFGKTCDLPVDFTFDLPVDRSAAADIPPAGTGEAPEGRLLYYRVRQRTVLDDYSGWSAVAGAQ